MRPVKLGELFALPLQSAVRAQFLAFQETIHLLEDFGLDKEKGELYSLRVKTERLVEERVLDEKGRPNLQFKTQPFEIVMPLLALIPPPSMEIKEMNVEFGIEIVEPRKEPLVSGGTGLSPSSLAASPSFFTPLDEAGRGTMKVTMKITKAVPEGLARFGDLLADLLAGRPAGEGRPSSSTGPSSLPVEKVPGIGPETAGLLKAKGISTVQDFVRATAGEEDRKRLGKELKVPLKRLTEWYEKAKILLGEEEK